MSDENGNPWDDQDNEYEMAKDAADDRKLQEWKSGERRINGKLIGEK